jgi:hypothetical protein
MNSKYHGLKIYYWSARVNIPESPLKIPLKGFKYWFIILCEFFPLNLFTIQIGLYTNRESLTCSTKLYIRHFSILSILNRKRPKKVFFFTYRIPCFFQYVDQMSSSEIDYKKKLYITL